MVSLRYALKASNSAPVLCKYLWLERRTPLLPFSNFIWQFAANNLLYSFPLENYIKTRVVSVDRSMGQQFTNESDAHQQPPNSKCIVLSCDSKALPRFVVAIAATANSTGPVERRRSLAIALQHYRRTLSSVRVSSAVTQSTAGFVVFVMASSMYLLLLCFKHRYLATKLCSSSKLLGSDYKTGGLAACVLSKVFWEIYCEIWQLIFK